jgi:hypothetical protein
MADPITIPAPDVLRAEIRALAEELRARRQLLRLAEAAERARRLAAARETPGQADEKGVPRAS